MILGSSFYFVLVVFYLFHDQFLKFCAEIEGVKTLIIQRFISFALIYLMFFIVSMLQFSLLVNWFFFLIGMCISIYVVVKDNLSISLSLSLFCMILGLSVNVFFRSLMAIIWNVPLYSFDNKLSSLKTIPVFLGFLVMGMMFYIFRRLNFATKLKIMLQKKESVYFYIIVEGFIYLFIALQLLMYTQNKNDIITKLWGIKAAVFSNITLIVAHFYTSRIASLHVYMDKKHETYQKLTADKEDVEKLWKLAYIDMLTECGNRQLFELRIEEYKNYGLTITLAYVDLNGLKIVNDQYGHYEGDQYLIEVANLLNEMSNKNHLDTFRHGGDEFIIISTDIDEIELEMHLKKLNRQLNEISKNLQTYHMSISYGICRGECDDINKLIKKADEKMYHFKLEYYSYTSHL